MKRIPAVPYLVLVLSFVLFLSLLTAAGTSGQSTSDYVEDEVIVKFKAGTPPGEISSVQSSLGAVVLDRFTGIKAEQWKIQAMSVQAAVAAFAADPRIEYIEPNYYVYADQTYPNDPRFPEMWGLDNIGQTGGTPDADIDAPEGWDFETGDDVLVGVIDTGADWHHVDLAANIYTNPGEIPDNGIDDDGNGFVDDVHGWDFVNNDNDPFDDAGHGTHTSGTIGAVGNNGVGVVGVSWKVKILPIKFLNSGGSGTTTDAIRSVEYATLMGVKLTNNSWGGGGFSQGLMDAIADAGDHGILFVAAAGNNGGDNDIDPRYPASFDLDNIIAVANTNHFDQLSSSSNWGATTVDLGAPGSLILSTLPGNGYGIASGTSMASPHVAGAASLLWSAAPSLTHLEVKDAILAAVDPIPALQGKTVSGGRLNIYNFLSVLDSIPPGKVVDLRVASTSSNTATLEWTATGDDSTDGTAARYDIRYSESQIYWSNFDQAKPVPNPPAPAPSGSPETFEVWGLDFNTAYSFALKVYDEQDNVSWISNLPRMATTLGIPHLAYAPASFTDDLLTGGTSTQALTIENTGEGTLDFSCSGLPGWLSAVPPSGRIPAGESAQVDVVFDATGMPGGVHSGSLTLETNDPGQAAVAIPVTLTVTNAADIAVAPEALDFGAVYIGLGADLALTVSNIGTAYLNVSGVAIDNAEFNVESGGFVLAPSASRVLAVGYAPITAGPVSGTLSIYSDDPDHPQLDVPLSGEGLEPPVLSVSPSSLEDTLYTGGRSTHPMTISNLGGSDLEFELSISLPVAAAGSRVENAVASLVERSGVLDGEFAITSPLVDTGEEYKKVYSGPDDIAAVAYSPGGVGLNVAIVASMGPPSRGLDVQAKLLATGRFGSVTIIDAAVVTPTLAELQAFDGVLVWSNAPFVSPVELGNNLADYVDGGGGVVCAIFATAGGPVAGRFNTDNYWAIFPSSNYYGPQAYLGTVFEPLHPTVAGVTSFDGGSSSFRQTSFDVAAGATRVADWTDDRALVAARTIDGHERADLGFYPPSSDDRPDFWVVGTDGDLLMANALEWVAGGRWLTAEPKSGELAPGQSMQVNVTFDAARLNGGDYNGDIVVATPDPVNVDQFIPAHLHVIGAPDAVVSDSLLTFGQVFVGASVTRELVVGNDGTDVLAVVNVGANPPDYTADPASFSLEPGASQTIQVSFAPASAAVIPGVLVIESNDPDEPAISVVLEGEGLDPPVIAVSPSSIEDDLFTGESSSHLMTISNSGGSNLEFIIAAREPDSTMAFRVDKRLHIPASDGEFPRGSAPPSIGTAPQSAPPTGAPSTPPIVTRTGGSSFATETQNGIFVSLDLNAPEVFNVIASAPQFIWAGDFALGDNSFVYALNDLNQFMQIDSTTGTQTVLGTLSPWGGEDFTGMATDPTDGTIYLCSTNISASSLYRLDVDDAAATRIGPIGFPGIIAIAVDNRGEMYAHDIVTDELVRIDITTGAGTVVGSLGFDANYGQGMAFDAASGELLLAAFNNATLEAQLRVADRETGATALLGLLGSSVPGGMVQLGWLGIPGGGLPWLAADPATGTVPPGTSMDVTITFDAGGLFGGDYTGEIVVESNDPLSPEVAVPASLHVTGAPDMWLSANAFDFGEVFVGAAVTDSLVVKNVGTDVLMVGNVGTDHSDYTVDATAFDLPPGQSRVVLVSFAPTTATVTTAHLTIESNDPDEPLVTVDLAGEGLEPPVISVTPDSLSADLLTGEVSMQTITIGNSGASDLSFEIGILARSSGVIAVQAATRMPAPEIPGKSEGPLRAPALDAASSGLAPEETAGQVFDIGVDLTPSPLDIIFEDGFEDGNFDGWLLGQGSGVREVTDETAANGTLYSYHEYNSTSGHYTGIYHSLGASQPGYIGFYIRSSSTSHHDAYAVFRSSSGTTAIWFFANAFGFLYCNADVGGDESVPYAANQWYHIEFKNIDFTTKTFDYYVDETLITTGVSFRSGPAINDFARVDLYNYSGGAEAWWDEIFISTGEEPSAWLEAHPLTGTVPAGASVDIQVTFDASGLIGGAYDANIVIQDNDPLNPVVTVPAHLDVTGAPDIAVSDSVLECGAAYVGASTTRTLTVSNAGTDVLTVSDVSSDLGDYTVDASSFVLAPGQGQDIIVTFAPASPGERAGTLTLSSDDPDESTLSVVLRGEGLEPPVISVSPDSLGDDLLTGGISTHTLTIDNTGGGELTFGIEITDLTSGVSPPGGAKEGIGGLGSLIARSAAARQEAPPGMAGNRFGYVELREFNKGEEDGRIYPAMELSAGGPDPFGYVWRDNNEPDGPVFGWIDAGGGTAIPLGDDSFVTRIPLGFTFDYYGTEYTEIGVGSNGWLSFNGSDGWYPGNVPANDAYAGAIAPFARDLYPPAANYVRYRTFGTAPRRYFVVEYNNIPDFPSGFNKTFEVVFYEGSNDIRFQYLTAPNTPAGFGIESPDQSMGMGNAGSDDLFISPALVHSGYAIEFSARAKWITVVPEAGTVPPGESGTVEVTFDATGLLGGSYDAGVVVTSNDPIHPEVVVPAHLGVTGAPDIAVSDSLLSFGPLFIGGSSVQSFVVSNLGTDLLTVSEVSADLTDYSVDATSFTLAPGTDREVAVTFSPVAVGARNATLTITSDDPDEGQIAIALEGEGLDPPQIAVSPDSLHDDLFSGEMSMHTLTIGNAGGSDLVFSIQTTETTAGPVVSDGGESPASVSWLDLSQISGTVPAGGSLDISVTFDASSLIGGAYGADIAFATNVPSHPGVVVPVTLDVTGVPHIVVSDTLVDFSTVYIGYPETRNFVVSNSGTDVLTVSDVSVDQPEFTVVPGSFQVPTGADQLVQVTYDPTSAGPTTAVLTISSDDPDRSAVEVDLVAEALVPPVVTTSVDSLAVTVPAGQTAVESFMIGNGGGSGLDWAIEAGFRANAPLRPIVAGTAPGSKDPGPDGSGVDRTEASVIDVLWYGNHGLGDIDYWSIIISDITARGAGVTQSSDPITPAMLSGVEVLWLGNTAASFSAPERTAIVDWVNAGGCILIEADNDEAVRAYTELLHDLGAGLGYLFIDGFSGPTTFISPHVTTANVDQLYLLTPGAQLTVAEPGGLLFTDLLGAPMGAYSEVGEGRIVALSDQIFHDVVIDEADNRLFGNQVFGWLALGGFSWLSITPATGTLGPGDDVEVTLELNGSILPAGSYDLQLDVLSNDPASPVVTIPMQVVVDSTITITGLAGDGVPAEYRLHPNYPNPFNPTTTIRYDLPRPEDVRIVIYNVRGEMVRVLLDEHRPAGRHDVAWDGRNSRGETVATGVYLYRIVAGEFVSTRKMTLLK